MPTPTRSAGVRRIVPLVAGLGLLVAGLPAAASAANGPAAPPAATTAAAPTALLTTLEGTLSTWHGDTSPAPKERGVILQVGLRAVPVAMSYDAAARMAGRRVRIQGALRNGILEPSAEPQVVSADGTGTQPSTDVVAAATPKQVAVILVKWDSAAADPWTTTNVEDLVLDADRTNPSSVRAFFEESSENAITLSGNVFGWYAIATPAATCDYRAVASSARAAASADALAAGVDLSSTSVIKVYAFPSLSGCGWAGLGELPGDEAWINNSMNLRVIAHELGHNLGVHHASTLRCTDSANIATTVTSRRADDCTANEYGDPFTLMGNSSTATHQAWHRQQSGWPTGQQVISVTAGLNQNYTITAQEPGPDLATSTTLLRITRPTSPVSYVDLELRGSLPRFDSWASTSLAATGVTARIGFANSNRTQSLLLDATLGTSSFSDAPLSAGTSIYDPVSGARITVVSSSGGQAIVNVTSDPDASAPTAPPTMTATASGTPSVALTWGASTDDKVLAGYEVRRGGVRVAVVKGTSWTDTCPASGTCPLTGGGTFTYDVLAYDAAGKISTATSRTVTIPTNDVTPPTTPGSLTVTDVTPTTVSLSWSASTDSGSGVAGYEIRRTTVSTGDVAPLDLTTATVATLQSLTAGTAYAYEVRAYDGAGNRGAWTSALAVTTEPIPGTPATVSAAFTSLSGTVTFAAVDAFATYEVRQESFDTRKNQWVIGTVVARPGVCLTATCSTAVTVGKAGSYRYSVRAINGTAASGWATSASVAVTSTSSGGKPPKTR